MVLTNKLRRSVTLAVAAVLFAASLVPLLTRQTASAYGLVTSRSIEMSSSVNGSVAQNATTGQIGGQNVVYSVSFTTATTASVGSVVVEFCDGSSSPIIGDTCTAPTGFDLHALNPGATLAINTSTGITGLSVDNTNSTANELVLTRTAGSVNSGVATNFVLGTPGANLYNNTNGITNPTDTDSVTGGTQNGTFYARIHTKASTDGSGADIDAGGIALSLNNQITITSKVQERLTFCVFVDATFAPTNDCSTQNQSVTSINLGDDHGVLDDAGAYADGTAFYTISTNATSGAAIRLKGTTLKLSAACSDSPGQNCSIDPIGGTAAQRAIGTEQFGLCTYEFTAGSSSLTVDSTYDGTGGGTGVCANGSGLSSPDDSNSGTSNAQTAGVVGGTEPYFAYDTSNTITTYGDTVATKPAGTPSTGRFFFLGDIASNTEPGIYSTTLNLIATGTY